MFELTISTTLDKQSYISELLKKLKAEIAKDKGVIAKEHVGGRSKLAIAVPLEKKEYYKAKILEHITYMIEDDYKFNFYKDNLMQGSMHNVVFQSFLKAISIFDAEIDKDVIAAQTYFSGEILVDSLFYFKLQKLQQRWKRAAEIINQNQILHNKSAMIEILKYLVNTSDSFVMDLSVRLTNNQIMLKNNTTKKYKNNFSGVSDFLTEIVRLNPLKINLDMKKGVKSHDELLDLLQDIFSEKIYLVN